MKKIACYGWVDSGGASLVGSNYLVIEQLLELGYTIDFYGNPQHVSPLGVPTGDSISYQPATVRERAPYLLGKRSGKAFGLIRSFWIQPKWDRAYTAAITKAGGAKQYDLLLTLGTPPAFTLPGIPTISWLQGVPGSELEAIRNIRAYFLRLGFQGALTYAALQFYYRISDFKDRHELEACTRLICGSQWSRQRLQAKFTGKVDVLPYAIDLDRFLPNPANIGAKRVLWLGRLDPRKRLDLFVDSAPIIQNVFPDVTFTVVGAASYAKSQLHLLDGLRSRCNLEFIEHLDRNSVPNFLSESLVLVQPSLYENFGSSVAEAAAAGVPSVIGPSNGTGDYLGNCAIVFQEYTAESVADAVIGAIRKRRSHFVTVTEETRAEAEAAFSARDIAVRLAKIIEDTSISGPGENPPFKR